MSLKAKFFKMLGELDEAERQQLKTLFDVEESTPQETKQVAPQETETSKATETEPPAKVTAETTETVENDMGESDTDSMQESSDSISEKGSEKEFPATEQVSETAETELEEDDNGDELPVDYQSIVEAQNAKILALEAENAKLRQKTDGAFGFAGKSPMLAKVNPLYDNDVSDIHFKR